ncbi:MULTISPECIES: T9SS type A sorting domain-containing protein [unclassified Lentimicrobium]|uniref:T9SS type A sorting domain-containing protein n=1 Tax=unclassified Lentimicrobium TaxID=2677434 RepID=UPI001552ED3E|nr:MULTISPECIES: T9SS type A sorting domain-containing protein [unclassified Lentimicrobium]NPD46714.1 T9SS type A sorting domain-containing protein [Lentimicrobium sp. S6]NPD85510.1 T9SS type A sorting domain-containing protein [Lentimicrobium sp. L6]
MKRILQSIILIVSILLSINITNAQCTPDPNCTDPEGDGEFCPTDFPSAIEDEYYEQVLTIISPTEQEGVVLDHIEIVTINNIPPGMNYQCQDNNCDFYPQIPKCVNVFGTPEVDSWGEYKLYITIEVFIDLFGVVISAGEIVDSSSVVTVLPKLHSDFSISLEEDNVMCYENTYEVNYTGNANTDAIYHWNFGESLIILSGEGQGPYMVSPVSGSGLDSITLFVEEGVYTSPVSSNSFFITSCMGLDEQFASLFTVSPNPFVEGITCYGLNGEPVELIVYDLSGNQIHVEIISSNDHYIDLGQLNRGVYLLSLTNTQSTQTLKIIKQ